MAHAKWPTHLRHIVQLLAYIVLQRKPLLALEQHTAHERQHHANLHVRYMLEQLLRRRAVVRLELQAPPQHEEQVIGVAMARRHGVPAEPTKRQQLSLRARTTAHNAPPVEDAQVAHIGERVLRESNRVNNAANRPNVHTLIHGLAREHVDLLRRTIRSRGEALEISLHRT